MLLTRLAVAAMACCAGLSQAQDNRGPDSKIEVFGGYAANKFFYTESGGDNPVANAASLFDFGWDRHSGFETSIARNFNRYLGVKADFPLYSSHTQGNTTLGMTFKVPEKAAYFMAGPELKMRNRSRWTPFVHALFGGVHSWANLIVALPDDPITTFRQSHSRTGFGMAFGGGLDYRLTRRVSLRAMTDYSATFLGNPDIEESGKQNNTRFAMGLLFRLR
jgi:opacity protein-like surface antigen